MAQNDDALRMELAEGLSKILSKHGFGFHYAVMRKAQSVFDEGRSKWCLEAAEFPVTVGPDTTHIDFILRSVGGFTFLVAECKRADPRTARWTFVRAPYTAQNARRGELVFEQVEYDPAGSPRAVVKTAETPGQPTHIGLELKTHATGDGISSGSQINDAAAQVLRGTNGLINHVFRAARARLDRPGQLLFLPVVFTTAELWVSDVDLGDANIETGGVSVERVSRLPWLWFNHNQSPRLMHEVRRDELSPDLSTSLRRESCRTIAVVSAAGVEEFLRWDLEGWIRG